MAAFVTARSVYDGHVNQLSQAVAADFITQGHYAAHLRSMRSLYRSRRDGLLAALQKHVPWATPLNAAGGLQFAVTLPRGTEQKLSREAAAVGVATPSLRALCHGPKKMDGWLLGFAALQPGEIERAVRKLGNIRLKESRTP